MSSLHVAASVVAVQTADIALLVMDVHGMRFMRILPSPTFVVG